MKIIAVIAIHGRKHLTTETISRLKRQTLGLYKIVLVGSDSADGEVAKGAAADFVLYKNEPLGAKWQAGIDYAGTYDPDAILILGSDDWLSNNWCEVMSKELEGFDMVGSDTIYFYNPGTRELIKWSGYSERVLSKRPRTGEPIGAGRLFSGRFLKRFNWELFSTDLNRSLDGDSYQRLISRGGKAKLVKNDSIYIIDIKHPKQNMTSFERIKYYSTYEKISNSADWIRLKFPDSISFFGGLK